MSFLLNWRIYWALSRLKIHQSLYLVKVRKDDYWMCNSGLFKMVCSLYENSIWKENLENWWKCCYFYVITGLTNSRYSVINKYVVAFFGLFCLLDVPSPLANKVQQWTYFGVSHHKQLHILLQFSEVIMAKMALIKASQTATWKRPSLVSECLLQAQADDEATAFFGSLDKCNDRLW